LKEGIDRYIWPMTLADRGLSDHVDRACHALCLDDERPTFRPVLWSDPTIDPDRLTQVWFPGVHANVGGGYPDDGLAYVTLQWMMDEAVRSGLRFYPQLRAEYGDRVDVQGEQYDSRSGLGGYYRYGPRDVDSLCADAEHDVSVAHPLIHDSALQRIQRWQVAYASVSFPSLPRGYIRLVRQVADPTVAALPPPPALAPAPPIETPAQIRERAKDMEDFVADAVFRRRAAYLVTVAFTALLAMLPVFDWIANSGFWGTVSTKLGDSPPGLNRLLSAPFLGLAWLGDELSRIPGWSWGTKALGEALTWTVGQGFFPAWVSFWLKSYAGHPALFLFCGLVVLWLFFRKSEQLQEQVFARTEYAWRRI
jgi:hypothetical protein